MKGIPNAPHTMLARIIRILYSKETPTEGIKYYDLLQQLLVSGSVLMSELNEALEVERFVDWDRDKNMVYPRM